MLPLNEIPLNAYSWTFGALVTYAMGYRTLRFYRQSPYRHSPLAFSKYLGLTFFAIATNMALFGIPYFFTRDLAVLRNAMIAGSAAFYVGSFFESQLLCIMVFTGKRWLRYVVGGITIVSGAVAMVINYYTSYVYIEQGLRQYFYSPYEGIILSIQLLTLFVPVGIIFAFKGIRTPDTTMKLRYLSYSIIWLSLTIISAITAIIFEGYETLLMTVVSALAYIMILGILLLPAKKVPASA